MPSFKNKLSRQEIWRVIAYMRAGFPSPPARWSHVNDCGSIRLPARVNPKTGERIFAQDRGQAGQDRSACRYGHARGWRDRARPYSAKSLRAMLRQRLPTSLGLIRRSVW